jgi:outer membrane lipoprotein-sorting protein
VRRTPALLAVLIAMIATTATHAAALDPVARLEKGLAATHDAQARFVQTRSSALLPSPETARGRLWLRRPADVRLEYETPAALTLLKRGDSAFVHTPSLQQVQVTTARDSGVPLGWVLGSSLAEIRKSATVSSSGEEVLIVPNRSLGLPWTSVRLGFGAGDFPVRWRLKDASGDEIEIRLHDLARNRGLPESRFASAWPKGTRVIALKR